MIARSARPRLSSKAKLRDDKKSGQKVLLYPEKGLLLNATGAAILTLCTGELSFEQIVQKLGEQFEEGPLDALEAHVDAFLSGLAERGLIEGLAP